MGGDFLFNNLSGAFLASGAINSIAVASGLTGYALTINPVNTTATVGLSEVGTTSALGAVTVGSGGGVTTLNGNIFTAGGAVNLGGPVTLAGLSGGTITIDTTRLANTAGANISFLQTLGGTQSLTLLGGSDGILNFGGNVTQLTGLNVTSGAAFNVNNGSSFTVAGPIVITPSLTTTGNSLTLETTGVGNGITLTGGVDLSSIATGVDGGNLTITSTGAVNVNGSILSRGDSTLGFPGSNGGTIAIQGTSVTVQTVNLEGGAGQTGGRGGAGGSLSLTSTAGDVNVSVVDVSGGAGATGGDGGAAGSLALSSTGGQSMLNGSITASGGDGAGTGSGGAATTLSLGNVQIGGPSVSITALGGDNGTGTGRGADGNLAFGAVTGAVTGANSLQLDVGAGTVTFSGAVGTTQLGQITIQNARNVTFSSTLSATKFVQNGSVPEGGIYTDDNQDGTTTFNGTVTLAGTGTVLDFTGYNFIFAGGVAVAALNGSVNGVINGVLSVNSAFNLGGDMTLAAGAVPGVTPRVDLNVTGTSAITTTAGSLSFGTAGNPLNVRLGADTTLDTGADGGAIFFGGLVNSDATGRSLTLNSGGVVTFNSFVGNLSPLASLTTDAGGSLNLAAVGTRSTPSISATGGLTFNDQLQLNAATVLKADAVTLSGTGLMDGANSLLVLLNTGGLNFVGQVGQSTALTSLRVEGGSGTTMGFAGTQANPSIKTTGNQYYGNLVNLADDTVLNAGSMDFLSTINGANSLLLDVAGNINLYGTVGSTAALSQFQTSGGGTLNLLAAGATGLSPSIQTTGAQLFGSSLVLGEDSFLNSTGTGDFIFLNTINSRFANQPRSLSVV
jgi:hypothetical protein